MLHAFTQDGDAVDAIEKLNDLDQALATMRSTSPRSNFTAASLISQVCERHPRALQVLNFINLF